MQVGAPALLDWATTGRGGEWDKESKGTWENREGEREREKETYRETARKRLCVCLPVARVCARACVCVYE